MLSLTPECLHLLHLQRGVLGWRRAHEAQCPLAAGDDFPASLQQQLQASVQQWQLPPETRAHWVLAGDILGLVAAQPPGTPAAALLPFLPSDVRTQPDLFARTGPAGTLWIHQDWLAEIERISVQCGLQLVELYARAQLFQREAARARGAAGACKAVLEQLEGPQPQNFLHLYGANASLARSRVLSASEASQNLPDILSAELAALAAQPASATADPSPAPVLLTSQRPEPAQEGRAAEPRWQALQPRSEADRLWQLWRSDIEGISVRATHEEWLGTLKGLSLGLGLLGAAALAAMIWHDGQLQQQIEQDGSAVRRDRPRVEQARALKARSLQMAAAVQAARALQADNAALAGLAQISAQWPPPPATLLYLRSDAGGLAFAGSGDEASAQALREPGIPGYGPLTELPLPDFLSEAAPSIHLQAKRLPPEAAPAAAAASTPAREGGA